MRRLLLLGGAVLALGILVWLIMQGLPASQVQSPASPGPGSQATLPPVRAGNQVVADGIVVPIRHASLSLPAGGKIAEIQVSEGQEVEAGQILLRLDGSRQQAGVAQAEAGLQAIQARLAELQAGPRAPEVAAAQAAVDAAKARLERLQGGARPEEIAISQAALDGAEAALQKVREGADPNQLIAAQAELDNARAVLNQAQAAYDQVSWREDIGRLPQSLELQRATNAYSAAQARLDQLKSGATAADIAAAQAQVRQAQAQLDMVQAPALAADLAAARADLQSAQAQLDLLITGPRPETLAVLEAEAASAQAVLDQARAALAELELRAPFAGIVALLRPAVGEQVSAGSPLIELADLSRWQVETDDLTELQVVQVGEGASATIELDALPGLTLAGSVERISSIGESKQGDVTYTVVIDLTGNDPRLRWNMTALVTIEPS